MAKSTTLGDFTILQKLGEGSFGQVFRVRRVSDQCEYAMKKVKIAMLKLKERENALNEIRILASITDPHIIGYKEAFFDEISNQLCVIMEFASNGDISKLIHNNVKSKTYIDEKEIWKALAHMTLGLRVLHKTGILHRDLKSANVFRASDGSYKIGDLNVSKVSHGLLAKTQTGTPYYASPEVWRDQPYSSPSDIWSLGCVIYEMTCLKPPFRAQDVQSLYKKIQTGIFEKIPKNYSQQLQNMISWLLKVPANQRPTCDQILGDPNIKNYVEEYIKSDPDKTAELLQTILFPKNLKQLQAKLPKPTYENNPENKENRDYNSLRCPPKSTRSSSVNDKKCSPSKDIQQLPRKDISRPRIPQGPRQPIRQTSLNRPSSSVKNLSPALQRNKSQNEDTNIKRCNISHQHIQQ